MAGRIYYCQHSSIMYCCLLICMLFTETEANKSLIIPVFTTPSRTIVYLLLVTKIIYRQDTSYYNNNNTLLHSNLLMFAYVYVYIWRNYLSPKAIRHHHKASRAFSQPLFIAIRFFLLKCFLTSNFFTICLEMS